MSLAIDVDLVTQVLLIDGWHEVADQSFMLDAYEFVYKGETSEGGLGGGDDALISATGFGFTDEAGDRISGPLTSILAVKHREAPVREEL